MVDGMNDTHRNRNRPTRCLAMAIRLAMLAIMLLPLSACQAESAREYVSGDALNVVLNDQAFTLELAMDSASRTQGLSDRESVAPDGGMLFVFRDAQRRSFVMRRCLVPIDIAFLDPAGRVIAMHAMQVEPYDTPESELKRYDSRWPAQFAIEWAGGTLDRLGVQIGDRINLPLESLKREAR